MRLFEFTSYRKFLRERLRHLPSKGRGEFTRIAAALGVHTTMVSHVMKGETDFSLEQALKLADYLALNGLETDYLVALVQWERAGDARTRDYCRIKVEEMRKHALNLSSRLQTRNQLSEADRAFYYSSAAFAQVRLLSAIKRFQTFEALQAETGLPARKLRELVDFLISRGLCVEEDGRIKYGLLSTYIEAGSPLVARHHLNWRQKVQERLESLRPEDLAFTFPTAISEEDFLLIREKLVQFLEEFKKITPPSPSENLYCLNIDWLKISRG